MTPTILVLFLSHNYIKLFHDYRSMPIVIYLYHNISWSYSMRNNEEHPFITRVRIENREIVRVRGDMLLRARE